MKARKVFLIGNSLFAESLVKVLESSIDVQIIGSSHTSEEAIPFFEKNPPEVVIIATADENASAIYANILATFPKIPIIHADINTNQVQVITNHAIDAHISDFLAAIARLPDQNIDPNNETKDKKQQ